MPKPKVICVHIGARAHYLIPAALERNDQLHTLITDTWVGNSFWRYVLAKSPITAVRSLAGRYSSGIPNLKVQSFGWKFMIFELYLRLKSTYSWEQTLARDEKFEAEAVRLLQKSTGANTILGISYTSLKVFETASRKGLKKILFQVDPGFEEEELVASLAIASAHKTSWKRAPEHYWKQWRTECALADVILVNSDWSKSGLTKQGIDAAKIAILPLPYTVTSRHQGFVRSHPRAFSKERPLRCLFLGTLAMRKGIHIVIEAAKALAEYPVEFIFVGRTEINVQDLNGANMHYKGIITREETDDAYQHADVFLFPTFSDGFGLTQLEAMAWKLPVIATDRCGEVVIDAYNGWRMHKPEAKELVRIITEIISDPLTLQAKAENCLQTAARSSMENFLSDLSKLL